MATIRSLLRRLRESIAAGRERTEPSGNEPRNPSVRFEPRDANSRNVLLTGLGVLVGVFLVIVITLPLFDYFKSHRVKELVKLPVERGFPMPPPPRLQQSPRADLESFRAYEASRLQSYQWIDRARGVVSMPIEQAIQLTLQRGIPPRKAPPGNVYYDPREGSLHTGFDDRVVAIPR